MYCVFAIQLKMCLWNTFNWNKFLVYMLALKPFCLLSDKPIKQDKPIMQCIVVHDMIWYGMNWLLLALILRIKLNEILIKSRLMSMRAHKRNNMTRTLYLEIETYTFEKWKMEGEGTRRNGNRKYNNFRNHNKI